MSVTPCEKNREFRAKIDELAETLKTESHRLGNHGLDEQDFYDSGLFRGAIERIRGQFSATMGQKRDFVRRILNHMEDGGFIRDWESAGESNRHDYSVTLNNNRIAAIELKGCLDGNNTNIFDRPPHANEFIIWSICTNPGADPRHNAWSGLHTRLSAEIISRSQVIDGVLIWDMACGTTGRPCPKLASDPSRSTVVGAHVLPPPCIYLLPPTVPSPRNNSAPAPNELSDVGLLQAFYDCFGGAPEEINRVFISVEHQGAETLRTTRVERGGIVQRESTPSAIRRS